MPPEIKEAYDEFEAAIKTLLEKMERNYDVMTDWVLVTAQTELGPHVDSHAVGWEARIGQPLWHTKAMMTEVLDTINAVHIKNVVQDD